MKYNILLILSIIAVLAGGIAWGVGAQARTVQHVYNVCNASRISKTISEHDCGDLQDKTNTEFLCNANNDLSTNYCWVEVK